MRSTGWVKPLSCAILGVGAWLCYAWNLWDYLRSLQSPWPLFLAFMLSLILAVVHEVRHAFGRQALVNVTATVIGFAVAVLIAHQARDVYLGLVGDLNTAPEVDAFVHNWLGDDIVSAMTNRTVGYGGCYALGMTLARWVLHQRIRELLSRFFIEPVLQRCPHCNQPLKVARLVARPNLPRLGFRLAGGRTREATSEARQ